LSTVETPRLSFILSLIGGVLVFVGSAISIVWYMVGSAPFGSYWGMMDSWHGMMGNYGLSNDYMSAFSFIGLMCGIIVIIGAFMLNTRPLEHITWGKLVLVFSAVSLISMGGWFIGAVLGIIGGVFAISWKPR
jgi:hypothetical protein